MIILDKPGEFDGESILINFYHRTPVSLISNTKVWLCFIPRSENVPYPELIISPIDFNAWDDLWRIVITLNDGIGIVNEILQTIKDNGINILSMETNSINSQNVHQLEIIVDARRYANTPYDKLYKDRKDNLFISELRDLKRQFLSRVIDHIYFIGEKPRIKINRIYGLYHSHNTYTTTQIKYPTHKKLSPKVGTSFVKPISRQSLSPIRILLPHIIKESLKESLGYNDKSKKNHLITYLPISDTKDRFMRIYFFEEKDKVISFTLNHREIVGAVATITSAISSAGFNILTSHSRVDKFGENAVTDFVVEHPKKREKSKLKLIEILERALSDEELIEVYQIQISYPKKYNSKQEWKELKPIKQRQPSSGQKRTTESRLLLKHNELIKRKHELSLDEKMRFKLIKELIKEENLDEPKSDQYTVFISCPFQDPTLLERSQSILISHGFNAISGKDLSTGNKVRAELMSEIAASDYFLGIWTKENGIDLGNNKWFPSPWLFWEWGVAEGMHKPTKLIVSEEIDKASFYRVAPEQPYITLKYNIEESLIKAAKFFLNQ